MTAGEAIAAVSECGSLDQLVRLMRRLSRNDGPAVYEEAIALGLTLLRSRGPATAGTSCVCP